MRKLVEDAIDALIQGSWGDESCVTACDCKEEAEEEVVEDKKIEGLKVGFSVCDIDFDMADFSTMESRFKDEEYAESVKLLIRKKAIETLKTMGEDVSIRIQWTDPCISELF